MKCKNCGNELTQEMIDVNLCWTCGDIIDENFSEKNTEKNTIQENKDNLEMFNVCLQNNANISDRNLIGTILRTLGIMILVIGTIGSIVIANGSGEIYHRFSFLSFCIYEFITIVSGFVFIGFSEIIQLLHKINSK